MACPGPHDKTAHGTNGKKLEERGKKVRPVRQHVLESVRCMRANERRVQHVQVHNRSCVHAARISKRAMHGGMKRKLHACERSLHATCLAELHDQLPVRTQHTHNDQRGVLRERRAPRNDLGATTFALARGPLDRLLRRARPAAVTPAGAAPPCPRSAAAMSPARPPAAATPAGRSSTLPEVRWSERGVWREGARLKQLLKGKSSGPRPQFVPVPFGLNLPVNFVP